jgi:hypothetical protein
VPYDHQFWLFQDDDDGPLWRGSFDDIDDAKDQAQRLADAERHEFFVYSFSYFTEVGRMFPARGGSSPSTGLE